MSKYLSLLEKEKSFVKPNFWVSTEYFRMAGLKETEAGEWIFITDPDADEMVVLPPIHKEHGFGPFPPVDYIWSDFSGYDLNREFTKEFLDYEYLYNPRDFLEMEGKRWAVFRKNRKKFPERFAEQLEYVPATREHDRDLIILLKNWINFQGLDKVQDSKALINFVLQGENRKVLIGNEMILGINIYDTNYKYINFRYAISWPNKDFLNEYMRWLFYTDDCILNSGKLVNDGGILDNQDLKRFKDKLNPISVREVFSWTRR